LNVLLRHLRPYRALEERLGSAFVRSMQRVEELDPAHVALNQQMARFRYVRPDDQSSDAVRGANADFVNWARPDGEDETYFLAVFQQGLLRMWLRLAWRLESLTALAAANATVSALNAFAVKRPTSKHEVFLAPERAYCRRVLWRAETVNFSPEWARRAWHDILMSTLLRDDVRKAALDALPAEQQPQRDNYNKRLEDLGREATYDYTDRLWDETLRHTRNNLGDYFGELEAGRLREIKQTNRTKFEQDVSENALVRYRRALELLANSLGRHTDDLVRPA
jgi:hypothetical protein